MPQLPLVCEFRTRLCHGIHGQHHLFLTLLLEFESHLLPQRVLFLRQFEEACFAKDDALLNRGWVYARFGRMQLLAEHHQSALDLARFLRDGRAGLAAPLWRFLAIDTHAVR